VAKIFKLLTSLPGLSSKKGSTIIKKSRLSQSGCEEIEINDLGEKFEDNYIHISSISFQLNIGSIEKLSLLKNDAAGFAAKVLCKILN
jgi:hypothetical protein